MSKAKKSASAEAEIAQAKQAAAQAVASFRPKQQATKSEQWQAARGLWEQLRANSTVTDADRQALRQLLAALPREQLASVFEKAGAK